MRVSLIVWVKTSLTWFNVLNVTLYNYFRRKTKERDDGKTTGNTRFSATDNIMCTDCGKLNDSGNQACIACNRSLPIDLNSLSVNPSSSSSATTSNAVLTKVAMFRSMRNTPRNAGGGMLAAVVICEDQNIIVVTFKRG